MRPQVTSSDLAEWLLAGTAYFAGVFIAGVVLGTFRILVVAPAIGDLAAVLTELPLLLAWSWLVAGWIVRRCATRTGIASGAIMGATGFALLMLAEVGFSMFVEGISLRDWLSRFRDPPALAGLLGQIAFGMIPLLRSSSRPMSR
jgi:hypothetical protein